jgi:hypothetical protein
VPGITGPAWPRFSLGAMIRIDSFNKWLNLAVWLISVTYVAVLSGRAATLPNLEGLLGKSVTDQHVQDFIRTNRFMNEPGAGKYFTFYFSTNLPFLLVCETNHVVGVGVSLIAWSITRSGTNPPYTGKLPRDLVASGSVETVVQRLGAPSSRGLSTNSLWLRYDKLRLRLDFDRAQRLSSLWWSDN